VRHPGGGLVTSAQWIRVCTLLLAFPNIAFVWGFACHLCVQSRNPLYGDVFRAASICYAGVGVLIAGISWRQIELFQTPMRPGTVLLLVGQALILVGMVGQLKQLPRRRW